MPLALRGVYTGSDAWAPRFDPLGERLMSSSRDPGPDLSLEQLGDRDGLRRAHLGEAAQIRLLEGPVRRVGEFSAAYQALIDAIFTAPGAAEWLSGVWQRVSSILADRDAARPAAISRDAIRAAEPQPRRY
jgi:hypothetical protein